MECACKENLECLQAVQLQLQNEYFRREKYLKQVRSEYNNIYNNSFQYLIISNYCFLIARNYCFASWLQWIFLAYFLMLETVKLEIFNTIACRYKGLVKIQYKNRDKDT